MKVLINYFRQLRDSLNHPGNYDYVREISIGTSVPKVIHQIYSDKNLSPELLENIKQLKLMNPNWSYKLHDDHDIESYIKLHYPNLLSTYHKINPIYGAAKADFFRYLLIYNEGGVYLDIKSSASKPFDEIIRNEDLYLLSHWKNELGEPYENTGIHHKINNQYGEFQQWHIVATKGHPFLKAVINNVCHNIHTYNPFFNHTGRWGVLNVTGPIAYTLAITPHINQYPHRLERSNEDYSFIYSIFSKNQIPMHHSKFTKKHYSAFDESFTKQSFFTRILFKAVQPIKHKIFNFMKNVN